MQKSYWIINYDYYGTYGHCAKGKAAKKEYQHPSSDK